MIFLLVFVAFVHLAVEAKKPICLITAPSIIHLGVEETVSVQLHGATKSVSIKLYLKDHQTIVCEPRTVTLNEENQYQAVVTIKVDPVKFHSSNNNHQSYVTLVAECNDVFESETMALIPLSTRRGYIFIQTDKTIYNPGEHVKYRIFILDNYLLPINDDVNVQIFNSKGLLVYSHILKTSEILQRTFQIPDVGLAGHWRIRASFNNYLKSNTSVEFEVREYVLPSFEVTIKAEKHYLSLNNDNFQFSISARYTYGKRVNGVAYVRFGLIDSEGEKTYLPGTEKQIRVEDGHADVIVLIEELKTAAANQGLEHITDRYLYIAATVLEKASGDLEEIESSSVKIVTSPYVIDLSRTKKYFSPGGIFSILGTTSFPDGTRVPHLIIKAHVTIDGTTQTKESTGDDSGNIVITFQVPQQAKEISITVQAEGNNEHGIISDAKITCKAIADEDGSYLSVEVQHQILNPGQSLQVTFRDVTRAESARPSHIYYLVVSKGRVLKASRVQRTELTSLNLPFSVDMVPAFRLVAYYYSQAGSIVADSVLVDVKDVCKGTVEILPFSELKPAESFEVSIRTDSGSKVALSAVDSAVYILNKKGKLSPQKMFEYMNSYDLACSVGGGENSKSVLETAGLTFICNCKTKAAITTEHECFKDRQRHKRDLNALVNSYKQKDRKCCEDGRKKGLMMWSCDARLKYTAHQNQSCREAFKKCCEAAVAKRKKDKLNQMKSSLGRKLHYSFTGTKRPKHCSSMPMTLYTKPLTLTLLDTFGMNWNADCTTNPTGGLAGEEFDEVSVYLRSFFPQSWMWEILNADASGNIRHSAFAPDSITTWEVQAVAISPTKGFCIADPQPLKVFQDFFISLKLPYSVKRNEQLEVKVVVFNYKQQRLQVTVKMEQVEGLCTAGAGDVVQKVTVEPQSATAVYFTVVPMIMGDIPISILAYASHSIHDKIQKNLKVVGEGELVSIEKEYNIESRTGNKLEFEIPAPNDEVPGQESTTHMSFKGGVMGESVDNCLNLDGVNELIKLPTGCAEQTMVKMSPAINAMSYLDATNQWLSLKAERRDEARIMIQAGYTRVLTHKKDDGSYGAFLKTPSSIWLTAFIAKELTRARDIIDVTDSYIQEAISYLISKQKADGGWDDPNPLFDRGMKGGVGQSDDVPLTAYVLISLNHARSVYDLGTDTELRVSIAKARSYLLAHFDAQQNPYAVAILAYALSLDNRHSPEAVRAHQKLMGMASCDTKRCFWDVRGKVGGLEKKADAISVEATAYGLLQAVTMEDKRKALNIATWLTEQRKYGGGFQSTQDTVVALEALSKFSMQNNDMEGLDLSVELCVNDKPTKNLHLNKRTALTQTAIQINEVGKVVLNVRGQGKGTLSIMQIYRSLKKDESFCGDFGLSVFVDGEIAVLSDENEEEKLDDYYNYDYDGESREPKSKQDWFDLRTRRKRQAPEEPKKENTLFYTVCVSKKLGNSTGMVLVDISLLTGLTANIQDLEDNVKGTEKYIDHYDVHHNKVFLYFYEITDEETCVRFRAHQIIPIGLVQPAAAVIYDYYNPDRKCTVFYTAPKDSPMLTKLCEADICACAESGCPRLKVTFSKNMEENTRSTYACFTPLVDYIYTVQILNFSSDGVFKSYSMLITQVLQTGMDSAIQKGGVREMLQRSSCDEMELKFDADYLIMGQDKTLFVGNTGTRYLLNNKMWIEEIPPAAKCKATKGKRACQLLQTFLESYAQKQCSI